MNRATRTVANITARAEVEQDRLTIHDDDTDAKLYVKQKYEHKPLGVNETHLVLEVSTENGLVEVGLDGAQMDAVADAIHTIQGNYSGENNE